MGYIEIIRIVDTDQHVVIDRSTELDLFQGTMQECEEFLRELLGAF